MKKENVHLLVFGAVVALILGLIIARLATIKTAADADKDIAAENNH